MNNGYNDQQNSYEYKEPINFDIVNHNERERRETRLMLQQEKRNLSKIGLGYALFSIITLTVSLIISITVLYISPDLYSSALFRNALTPICLYLFALPILLLVISGSKATPPEKKKMSLKKWLTIFIVSYGVMYIGSFIGNYVMAYLSALMNYDYNNALTSVISEESLWITSIFTVVVAPIGEEFVFRKLIIDRTQKYGPVVSIMLSAVMFGLMHGNFYQFFYCFALGIILGYIYYSTGRLSLCIALHATINFFGGILTTLLQSTLTELAEFDSSSESLLNFVSNNVIGIIALIAWIILMISSLVCAIVVPIVFRKQIKLSRGSNQLPRGHVFNTVIINSGMLFMFITYFAEFGLNLLPL